MLIIYLVAGLLGLVVAGAGFILLYRVPGKTFDAGGVTLHYTDEGTGVPVVLVHGFGVQSDLNWRWAGCVRRLRGAGYRVITLDVRGHGRSGKPHAPEAYGTELCDDVIRLLDHLGIDRAHLAGYSMGGFITLKTADRHPDRLLSATVCAAGWSTLDTEIRALFDEIVAAMETRRVFDPITHWLEVDKRAPALQCAVVNFFMNRTNDVAAIVNVFRTFEQLAVAEERLAANTVPVLVLVGEADGIKPIADNLVGRMARHRQVTIPRGNHLTTILHPNFMRSMLAHLGENSPAA